jgi:hypothetical protein
MKNQIFKKISLLSLYVCLPLISLAWGQLGHRVVGQIAENHLNPKAHLAVKNILGHETLAMSANWADFVKSDKAFDYLYNWHFINLDGGLTTAELQKFLKTDTAVNAHTKIAYLRILVHLVGDIHQPMHTGHREDKGGNDIKLSWFGKSSNLHSIWDSELIESQELSYTEYAKSINPSTAKQRTTWQKDPLSIWIAESYQIASKLYSGVTMGDKLSYRYIHDHLGTANEQLLKGGVRLAGLLNEIFGS